MKFSESKILKIGGLRCDNKDCDYIDETINADDYEKLIGLPCPKCNASLLTREDYDALLEVLALEERMIEFGAKFTPKKDENSLNISVKLDMDGSGKIELGEIKIDG